MRTIKHLSNSIIRVCFLFICLSANLVVSAENDSIAKHMDKCRFEVTEIETPKSLAEMVSKDLCSRIWTELKEGGKTVFEFNEYGTVNIINESNDGEFKVTYYTWELIEEAGNAILLLKNQMDGKAKSFEVAQDCDGIYLTGMNGGAERFLSTGAIQ